MPKEAWKRVNFGSMELAKFYLGDFSRGDPYDNHSKYKEQPCLVSPPHNKTTTPRWKKPKELKRSTRCFLWQIPKSPFNTPIWQPHHKNNTMGKHNRQPLLTKLREKIILQGRLEDSCNGRKGRENGWKNMNRLKDKKFHAWFFGQSLARATFETIYGPQIWLFLESMYE